MPKFIDRTVLLLAIVLGFASAPAMSQTTSVTPNPPSSVCINGTNCVSAGSGTTSSAAIKWHPGQYMSSSIYTRLGNADASGNPAGPEKAAEIALVRSGPSQVLGWEGYYFWRALENAGPGAYDFTSAGSGLDADYVAITGYQSGSGSSAVYKNPRRMGIYILHTDYFSPDPTSRTVPDYILNSSTYGPVGPDGTHNGYWTDTGSAGAGTGSVAALWRPSVAARYAALFSGLANHVLPDGYTIDTSPYIEWVKLYMETTDYPQGATDSTYTTSGYLAQLESLNSAAQTAFAHTNYASTNNYFALPADSYNFELTLPSSRSGSSGPDTFGYSSGQNANTWGQAAYIGLKPSGNAWVSGGTSLIGVVPYLATVQNTETVSEWGFYFTPADIFKQANLTLHATHVSWQYVAGMPLSGYNAEDVTANWFGTASSLSTWSASSSGGVLATIVNNTLSNTTCPSRYKNGCNTK